MRCTFEDIDKANAILGHDSVYFDTIDDFVDPAVRFRIGEIFINSPICYVLSPNDFSIFVFVPANGVTYEAHTAILPDGRGRKGIEAGKSAVSWMFEYTECLKIMTWIPGFNHSAVLFAKSCGFNMEGNNRRSFLKGGILFDQFLYGISQEVWQCQQQSQ